MRKVLAALILALTPSLASAQITVSNWQQFSAGFTTSGPILFPDGTAGAPSISFANDPDSGFYSSSANVLGFSTAGTARMALSSAGGTLQLKSDMAYTWSSGNIGAASDTLLSRDAAANIQLGVDAGTNAVDQTLSAADATTAADISGGDLTIQSGSGMGTGAVSALIFQTPTVAAAGANPQAQATRFRADSGEAAFTVPSRVYNTAIDGTNYERTVNEWNTNIAILGARAAGTGVFRATRIYGSSINLFTGTTDAGSAQALTIATDSSVSVRAGASSTYTPVGGVLCSNTTAQATTGTSEEILATCTLPANAMSANGKGIRVFAWGTTAANGNTKIWRVRFGGIGGTIILTQSMTASAANWSTQGVVIRTGAATQVSGGSGISSTSAATFDTAPTQTLSGAVDIVVTGTTATAAGDLTFKGLLVEFFN